MSVVGFKYYETDKTFQPEKDTWARRTFFFKSKNTSYTSNEMTTVQNLGLLRMYLSTAKGATMLLTFLRKWSRLFVIGQLGLKLFIFKQNHPISSGSIKHQ